MGIQQAYTRFLTETRPAELRNPWEPDKPLPGEGGGDIGGVGEGGDGDDKEDGEDDEEEESLDEEESTGS